MEGMKCMKNGKIFKKILLVVLIFLVLVILAGVYFVWSKLSKVEYEKLDKSDLDVTTDIYEQVSDKVTEDEFNDIVTIALFGTDSKDPSNMDAGRSDTLDPSIKYGTKNNSPNTKYGTIILLNFCHTNPLYFCFSLVLNKNPDITKNIGT